MTKIKYRFKGHESFILREGWLNKGMREVRNDPFVFSQNYGADVLGVGPNMAKAIRYWMRTCGLLDERGKQGVFLSKLGEQIWEYDKYLEETFSLWIIHCNIVKNRRQATAWNLFFNEYDEMEFTKDELVKELVNKAGNLDGLEKFSEKSVEADGEALLRMYVRKPERGSDPEEKNISPFGIFELVKQKGSLYWKSQPPLHLRFLRRTAQQRKDFVIVVSLGDIIERAVLDSPYSVGYIAVSRQKNHFGFRYRRFDFRHQIDSVTVG